MGTMSAPEQSPETLSRATVDHVADLARLALSDQERELFRVQLSAILDYFGRLQALDSSPAEPFPALAAAGELREDEPQPSLPLDDVLANAPAVEGERLSVPVVLEDRG